jgi:hypothetical protein
VYTYRWRTIHRLGPSERQNSGQEEHDDDRSADRDATPPPLGVKFTVYRLLMMMIILFFGITKGILSYMGQSTAPTALDWVSGALLAAV